MTTEVKYGTSFGMCFGYCAHQITITEGSITSLHNYQGQVPSLENLSCTESYSGWNDLTESINFDEFKQLDDVMGCPDCADGGAEWIEITEGDATYRVTFEYQVAPTEVSDYIEELRSQMQAMQDICL